MQSAAAIHKTQIPFDEPVNLLLREKSDAVWSIAPEASVYQAIELMSQKKVGALVVLSGDCLEGIVSERDYARKVILKGRNSQHTAVREIMTTEVLFVTSQRNIGECMRLMTSRRVRHLPVVEDGKVVGVISMGDIVNWIIGCQEQTINHLQSYIAGSYPA